MMAGRPPVTGRSNPEEWGEASWEDRAEELAFIDEDDRLPWLESSDDVIATRRADPGRVLGLALLALTVLAVLVGGGWWLVARNSGPVADGSVIAAPEGPYKVRPADPGGKQHAGTGDTSFAVGEGQRREARLAERSPSAAATPPAGASPGSAAAPPAQTNTRTPSQEAEEPAQATLPGVGVQVGAYYSTDAAERGWTTLVRQTEALQGVRHRVVRGFSDIGTVYRLQAVAPDTASAERLCDALQADGLPCQVKR